MPRESVACIANIHAWPLSGCTIEIWRAALANTRITTDLPGKVKLIKLIFEAFNRILTFGYTYFLQIGKEMLTIKSKDGAEFNLLLELLRGEH